MSIFSEVYDGATETVENRGSDIGSYLANVVTDVFVKRQDPKIGDPTPAQIAQAQQTAKVTSMMKLAVPIGIGLLAIVFLLKKGK